MQDFDLTTIDNIQPEPAATVPADNIGDFLEIPTAPAPITSEEPTTEEKPEKPEASEAEKKELADRNAAMYVTLVDLLVSRGCSLFTGSDVERYKLSKSEKEEYTKVSAQYFYTINATVSPAAVFLVSTLTIFSSIFFRAYLDYKQKQKKNEEERKAAAAAKTAKFNEQRNESKAEEERNNKNIQINKEPEPAPEPKKEKPKFYKEEFIEATEERSNFEIYTIEDKPENSKTWTDSLIGKYKRSAQNDRWTYEECLKAQNNQPTAIIKMMIDQKRTAGKSWKDVNLEIRKFLKSLPLMIDK